MRRQELIRALARLEGFPSPDPAREQVATPADAVATLLGAASARQDLEGRSVLDLGSGTGLLAIGAALLGASPVVGVEADASAVEVARRNAATAGAEVEFRVGEVGAEPLAAETVVMNPPFGAQRAHADRPFWDAAFAGARRRIYAFALPDSRSFIARLGVARGARVESTEPVPWRLPPTFPHHRKRAVALSVELWVLSPGGNAP